MIVRVWAGAAVAAAALMPASTVSAQTAGETLELPAVVVTTASPVVKPTKKKAKAASSGQQPSADDVGSAAAAPPPDYVPLPGSIVATEGIFVPVTVTTQREFVAQGGATITDTLQLKPGISGTTFAPGADRPIIRGLDSYRIRTQENGIGTHDVAAISEDHAIPVDPLAADRVEVVRGPATLRYGSQAIGGVVSVENERIPTFIPRGGFSGRIIGGYSSVDDGADGAMSATAGSDGFAIHADAFKRRRRRLPVTARHGPQQLRRKRRRLGGRLACRHRRLSRRLVHALCQSLRHPRRGSGGRRQSAHRSRTGQGAGEGRVARARPRHRYDPLLVRRLRLRARRARHP